MPNITCRCAGLLLGLAFALPAWVQALETVPVKVDDYKNPIKLACVGDSITQGVGAGKGQSWPDQARKMLGDRWEVKNFGVSGSTLLNAGDKPYQKEGAFRNAKGFLPDVVVIILGTNDTKPQNWKHKDAFTADYQDMIKQFAELPSKPRLYACLPPYIAGKGNFGINEQNTKEEFPLITAAAAATHAGLIDVHGALEGKDALIPDRVHPNAAGATEIAKAVCRALTGKDPLPEAK